MGRSNLRRGLLVSGAALLIVALTACAQRSPAAPLESSGPGAMVRANDDGKKLTHEEYVKQHEEILLKQKKEADRQQREIEDLRRQQLHNESLQRYEAQ